MDVVQAVSSYITRIVTQNETKDGTNPGRMKVLLLDSDTITIVSSAITQSALLNHEVFLIDRIDNPSRERMRHLQCLCFVRPTPNSVQALVEELRDPKYGEYAISFSNVVKKSALERLAEADEHEVVKSIQEYFADFQVVNPDLCCLDLGPLRQRIWSNSPDTWNADALMKSVDGLGAILLALKKNPLIRYEKNSLMAKKLASEVRYFINQESTLFDFRKPDTSPILLVLDRRDDPVTPLLTQWTYQAMVHEQIGIRNGRVDLSQVPEIRPELREIVLNQDQDAFFKRTMFMNFGDLGGSIKDYVEQYQTKTKINANIDSIEDMKRFVEDFPEFRKLSGNVSKHVALVSELSRQVGATSLLDVSELEQSIACNDNHASDLKAIQKIIQTPGVPIENKLRIVALYGLRYEHNNATALPALLDLLAVAGKVPTSQIGMIQKVLHYHHSLQTVPAASGLSDLFDSSSILSGARDRFKGLKGVENVYTQHTPRLEATIQNLIKGRLSLQQYPYLESNITNKDKPQDIVVFMIGGATYEEAKTVAQLNATIPGVRIVLSGTTIHNSTSFLEEMSEAVTGWPSTVTKDANERLRSHITT